MANGVDPVPIDASSAPAALSSRKRLYILIVLMLFHTLNFLDRQIINILAEPIKIELDLADWQIGAMSGLAFALFYCIVGLPVARLSDRSNRVWIISGCIAVWSGFTAACGLAQNFVQLIAARFGVGFGEGGSSPPAQSLITEITPKAKRASALAFYALGIPIGSLLGMAIGGTVADQYGWRAAFLVAGIPGLAMALLILLTIRDPRASRGRRVAADQPSFVQVLKMVAGKPTYIWIALGAALAAFVSYGHQAFFGSFYLRNHGETVKLLADDAGIAGPIAYLGVTIGLILGIGGSLGTWIGGRVADVLGESSRVRGGYMVVPAAAMLAAIPVHTAAFLVADVTLSLALLALACVLKATWYGPVYASCQGLVPDCARATATAILLLVITIIGLGCGPLTAGVTSDLFARSMGPAEGLRWAMITLTLAGVAAALCFWRASRVLDADSVS